MLHDANPPAILRDRGQYTTILYVGQSLQLAAEILPPTRKGHVAAFILYLNRIIV